MVHQHDPDRRPDAELEPGEPRHLVAGNLGRLLDPRRTPVQIEELRLATGQFVVRILGFEDAGATWELPVERVSDFQFERGSRPAPPATLAAIADAIARFDRPLVIPIDPAVHATTVARLASLTADARAWLVEHGTFYPAGAALDLASPTGSPHLAHDLVTYLAVQGVLDLEGRFAADYVRNPASGELVKGHRIVLAEIGLVPYAGTIVRDPGLFDGPDAKPRRTAHLLHRLAFVRAAYDLAGVSAVRLYRGVCLGAAGLEPPHNKTFVSTSFDVAVARSCAGDIDPAGSGAVLHQRVSIDRLFMTYQETRELGAQYREAEAVLLFDPANPLF